MADVTMKVNLTNCSLEVQDSNGKVLQSIKADTKTVTLVSGDIYIFVLKSDDGYIFLEATTQSGVVNYAKLQNCFAIFSSASLLRLFPKKLCFSGKGKRAAY